MNSNRTTRLMLLVLAGGLALSEHSARAENWPQWRGARLDGISHEKDLPQSWSKTDNVTWRFALPGPAGATPVIWEDHIYLTSAEGSDLVLMAISTEGKQLWKHVIADHNQAIRGDEGNLASPSPSTDGKHVWTMMGTGDLACFSADGKQVWKFNLQDRYGKFKIMFGMASTPVLDGNRLYLQLLHAGGPLVLALDKSTGDEIWKQTRASDARAECEHSYASPVLYRDGKLELLLTHGCDYIVAHQLADGAEVWRCGGLNPKGKYNPTLRFVASPLAIPGIVIVPSAKNGPVLALDPASKGDLSDTTEGHFWTREHNTPDVPSPLVVDGLAYLCREDGTLICLDAKTGQEFYTKRTHSDRHRASPVYADGKIYLTARDGTVTVVKPGKEFEILATNSIGESISSSPVISNGRIYLRSFDALYAIGKGQN
ncbi:MAG TPA: PQQ-binding-like beta-propeller repeat protein [Pirellulales bacterium]|jgi:outer membrane protein assembly factor BamB|nr:PQQ-binding-like beta-propeller repeat protein [Pirellulales bacterium]